ncbi:hypothetical protein L210DRAFT_869498 [Boletus edulis BED1]|uniref:Uncharacterized protein n=1 Tax=Boletus edulis BED1 TaxID=1328754 RepID=A0AAD4BK43_BOLED|nr:hypothetical protein L210DRAFT_869498 [Boletus edulis BED1]
MTPFDNAVSLGIVGGDPDVLDTIPVGEGEVLEDERGEGGGIFRMQHMPFRVHRQHAAGLDDIPIAARLGHHRKPYSTLIIFALSGWYGRRYMETVGLLSLALVAGPDKPFYIIDEHWPPEAKQEPGPDCINSLVPEVVMGFLDQSVPLMLCYD